MADKLPAKPEGYAELLKELVADIQNARRRAASSINEELISLYWRIGRAILEHQQHLGWGAQVIDLLSQDLRRALPGTTGFSARNLRYMRDLARAWPDESNLATAVAKLPWGQNRALLDKVKDPTEREWYLRACLEHGWSRTRAGRSRRSRWPRRRRSAGACGAGAGSVDRTPACPWPPRRGEAGGLGHPRRRSHRQRLSRIGLPMTGRAKVPIRPLGAGQVSLPGRPRPPLRRDRRSSAA